MEMSQDLPLEPTQVSVSAESDTSSILIGAETPKQEEVPNISFLSEESLQNDFVPSETTNQENSSTEQNIDLGNLFGNTTPSPVDSVETTTPSQAEEMISTPTLEETPSIKEEVSQQSYTLGNVTKDDSSEETYTHPDEFIVASLEKIDTMIAHINTRHDAKLKEALEYKTEKEKLAVQEENAYTEAEAMVLERARAEEMRTYFQNEQSKNAWLSLFEEQKGEQPRTLNESVETALTGIAVQNAVTTTVEQPVINLVASNDDVPMAIAA